MRKLDVTPNILWICTDQQRYDTIGALGTFGLHASPAPNPHVRTPNLDRLVREGVAFTHAYCQSPICTPSRASFLTGRYPSTVHACGNGNDYWDEAAPLVTRLLKDAGYDCGLAGKLHLSAADRRVERRPRDDGYRVFHWSHDPRDWWPEGHAYKEWLAVKGHDLGELRQDPHAIPPELHQTTWCAQMAIDFIEEHAPGRERHGLPWLFSLNCFDPHPEFDPPQAYLDHFEPAAMPVPLFRESDLAAQAALAAAGVDFQTEARRPEAFDAKGKQAAYYAMIELIDDNVGRLLDALERTGQREHTVIVFTSDHGEALGDHGLLLKGCRFYEGLVRIPLIWSWPGHFRDDLRSDALVELTDIMPTLLDLAGLPVPERTQGRSLLPILTGQVPANEHRPFVRAEYVRALPPSPPGPAAQTPGRPRFTGTYATMWRDRRYKLVVYHGCGVGELFDLGDDPGEFVNLWDSPAHAGAKCDLLRQSFDALALAVDSGPPQTARF
ncbi:MAG: sulfatase-like hydrolase/transferase [Chloroflexi bacterium]|nr:sulfatase-like hydrolase/transferase [Chloroflexota bacterium]